MDHHFIVTGMTCGHCERSVRQAINQLDPGANVAIDRSAGSVDVQGTNQERATLADAIREQGYQVAA